ncbi:MAG: hypothetical protein MUE41_08075 [Gemmatimonadaceae bacterium]|nr:hypothetical protein [Gemmatimonadaceae bacterium]
MIRIALSIVIVALAVWWTRRTAALAPAAARVTYQRGVMALGAGLAGYLLLFTWYGALGQWSIGARALLLFAVILLSVAGLGLLAVARQRRRERGERARPLY